MTNVRKLISSCITCGCCLWFPVFASAVMTLEEVLEGIGIDEAALIAAGLHERAEEIIRSENERASRDVANIREITYPALNSSVPKLACGIQPLITVEGIEEMKKTSWENAQLRAEKHILALLHGEE